ncbi:MAG: hypothetical protein FWE50_04260 [Alphaproteobacteria bacterium]|nr:hypothetical protein [Alphaproteobacteria bacterium]
MKKFICFFIVAFCVFCAAADDITYDMPDVTDPYASAEADDYLYLEPEEETPPGRFTCTQQVFANVLTETENEVAEQDSEFQIQVWIYKNFQNPDIAKQVLACPDPRCEFESEDTGVACPSVSEVDDTDAIAFPPVMYRFPGGREITVNYETQPKILKQRVLLAGKRALPDSNPSPRVGDPNDPSVWTNTEPAWYGILVVQAGSLDQFVGDTDDKNNIVSLDYFERNFNEIYPRNHNTTTVRNLGGLITTPQCTSVSAFADNNDIVNIAGKRTVDLEGDDDDYYVAGVANLNWISWAQVALDVAITVVTVGGGTAILGTTKAARAASAAKNLAEVIKVAETGEKVVEFTKVTQSIAKSEKLLEAVKNPSKIIKSIEDIEKSITKLDKVKDAERIQELTKEADSLRKLQTEAKATDAKKVGDEIDALKKSEAELSKIDDVRKYKEYISTYEKLEEFRRGLKAWKLPQRGNVIARSFRTTKAALSALRAVNKGEKVISKGAKVARAGMKSGRIRDWLFQNTLKNVGRLARMERTMGKLYAFVKIAKTTYDFTETSTGDFTSNIQFTPLGLLSADNLKGQENVINHGMWLLWYGDSLSPADDDAAYLQAMDFANKFAMDMNDVQDELSGSRRAGTMCDVDIYVVRPIIRNPDSDDAQLYYLIMNDVPWTVRTGQ